MAQAFLTVAVACIIMAYWLKESPLAALAMVFFFVSGGFFYSASTSAWDLFGISGFAVIMGGGVASGMSMYLHRKGSEEEEGLNSLDDEVELGADTEEKKRKQRNKRIKDKKIETKDLR